MILTAHDRRIAWLLVTPLILAAGACAALAGDCLVGNLNEPVDPPAAGIFLGQESYAYFIDPPSQCSCPLDGFTVLSVTQVLYFDASQVPVVLQVQAGLREGLNDTGGLCWLPGPEICAGTVVPVTILEPGYHAVNVPLPGCPMQLYDGKYFLSLRYLQGGPGYLAIDDQPAPCVEYVDRGNGWEDMFVFGDKTGGGKSIIFGDVLCGALSVDVEAGAWGSLKSLYR